MIVRIIALVICCCSIAACAVQRAQVANEAQSKMIGMSKEQVLACMGPPANKATEGATEVWSYNSGNGYTAVSTISSADTTASVTGGPGYASGNASTVGSEFGVAHRRFCAVNVTMVNGRVGRLNYVGSTGGLLTAGEQCAFAVQNCTQ
jgi:hypothetical protein